MNKLFFTFFNSSIFFAKEGPAETIIAGLSLSVSLKEFTQCESKINGIFLNVASNQR